MARILALANQKGDVGKTTSAIDLGAAMAADARRVLLVEDAHQHPRRVTSGIDRVHDAEIRPDDGSRG